MTHDPREALEPCPFCGANVDLATSRRFGNEVFCDNCTARVPRDIWNTRALTASPGVVSVELLNIERATGDRLRSENDKLRATIASLSPSTSRPDAGGGVRVKPLEWEQPDGPEGTAWLGHGIEMCEYYIRFDTETASYWMPGERALSDDDDSAEEFLSLDDAKAAAQADYERRVLSALSNPPAAAESNASVEARLREALERIIVADTSQCEVRQYGVNKSIDMEGECAIIAREALTAVGNEAKKYEGGKKETFMTEDQIRHMVNRFLGWKLPANFNPDNGVSFNPIAGENGPHPFKREPSGTDLFDATQATEMVRYMIDGMPTPSSPTAERREIVARFKSVVEIMRSANQRGSLMCIWDSDIETMDKILAALDGGAGA